jgi:hypothetical protein
MSLITELQALPRIRRHVAGALDADIVHTLIAAASAGDNILIPSPGRSLSILEIFLWNGAGAQDLTLKNGILPLSKLSAMPQGSGYLLGFAGTGNAHFTIPAGNNFVLNLSVGSAVDGFVKYRIAI